MVRSNVATTKLVVGQLHFQDKDSLLYYFCNVFAYECVDYVECLLKI